MVQLPSFRSLREKNTVTDPDHTNGTSTPSSGPTITADVSARKRSKVLYHRLFRAILYLLALIFLILTLIGNTYDKPVLRDTYFLKIDLSDIIPRSVPNAVLINSIARSIGLHDFYQVGVWNFCEGYNDEGITHCSKPTKLYWFNPVEILLNELLSGATIALPSDIMDALKLARIASHWMFGLYIVAAVLIFLSIFLAPLAVSSRPPQSISANPQENDINHPHRRRNFVCCRAVPLCIFTFLTALATVVASAIATALYAIFAHVFVSQEADLNIGADLGKPILAFTWIAAGCTLIGFIVQVASCCAACCGGRKARKALKQGGLASGTGAEKHTSNARGNGIKKRFGWKKTRVEAA